MRTDMMKARFGIACGILLLAAATLRAEEAAVELIPRDSWTTVFGGTEAKIRFEVKSQEAFSGVLRWRHSYGNRTLQSGESAVQIPKGQAGAVTVPLRIGPVKDGVILPTQFSANLAAAGAGQPIAQLTQPITIFPENAFFERTAWLKSLEIQVFDPAGTTAEQLQDRGVPFTRIRDLTAIENLSAKLLIVGEGISFRKHRGLPEVLQQAAARGTGVLCLSPEEGMFPFPTEDPKPKGISLRDESIIREIDKHLDDRQWQTVEEIAANRFEITTQRTQVAAEITNNQKAWPWLEVTYPNEGRLIYSGFGVIKHWDAGPTPRYLLLRLIERLAGEPETDTIPTQSRRTP